jgi:HEAT repeat protein
VLVAVTGEARQPPAVRAAAADALVMMTGLRANGQDPGLWQRWWDANANKSPEQFKADLLERLRRPAPQAADLKPFLKSLYDTARPEARADFLVQSLAAPDPATRGAAVLWAGEVFDTSGQLATSVKERLRAMIRDGSPEVRQAVAQTLFRINDQLALVPLLAQLGQEPDPSARVDQIKAVAQIGDIRAVPPLLDLLNDRTPAVAAAAATALGARDLVPVIRRNRVTKAGVRQALMQKVLVNPNPQVASAPEQVRAACIEALGQLNGSDADKDLEGLFIGLIDPRANESPAIRRAALQSLGVLGNPQTTDLIKGMLTDRDRDVRLAAVNALGSVARFSLAGDALFNMFAPGAQMERDPVVQDAAWKAFQKLLPTADDPVLIDWADRRFRNQPGFRSVVLQALADKQEKAGKLNDLASTRENIGVELMKLPKPQTDKAADYFDKALAYWKDNKADIATIQQVARERENALLVGHRYADAAKFVQEMFGRDPAFQQPLGAQLTNHAEDLLKAGNYRDARDLSAEGLKLPDGVLAPRFVERLRKYVSSADEMLGTARQPPPPPR